MLRKDGLIQRVRTVDGRPLDEAEEPLDHSSFASGPTVHASSESDLLGLVFGPNHLVNRYPYVFVSVCDGRSPCSPV